MEDLKLLERNLRLRALAVHEGLSRIESWGGEGLRGVAAVVHYDVHGGRIVDKVFSKCIEGELVGVFLDKRSEDVGCFCGVAVREAVAVVTGRFRNPLFLVCADTCFRYRPRCSDSGAYECRGCGHSEDCDSEIHYLIVL